MLGHGSCCEVDVVMQSVSKLSFDFGGCGSALFEFVHTSIRDNGGAEV